MPAAYGAGKAGRLHLATGLAVEWAPAVRVNCVVPGMVATGSATERSGDADSVAAIAANVPLQQLASPGRSPAESLSARLRRTQRCPSAGC